MLYSVTKIIQRNTLCRVSELFVHSEVRAFVESWDWSYNDFTADFFKHFDLLKNIRIRSKC